MTLIMLSVQQNIETHFMPSKINNQSINNILTTHKEHTTLPDIYHLSTPFIISFAIIHPLYSVHPKLLNIFTIITHPWFSFSLLQSERQLYRSLYESENDPIHFCKVNDNFIVHFTKVKTTPSTFAKWTTTLSFTLRKWKKSAKMNEKRGNGME